MSRRIPDEILDEIRRKADLAQVVGSFTALKKKGGDDLWACCPFHKEKTPSFKINQQRQVYYCFGCKKSGNIFHFVQEMVNTDFIGAVEWLANHLGIIIPPSTGDSKSDAEAARKRQFREDGFRLLKDTAAFYQRMLQQPEAEIARSYLRERGLDPDAINKFAIGYSPDSWDALGNWAATQGYSRDLLVQTGLSIRKEGQKEHCYDRFRGRLMFPICDELGRVVGFSARTLESHPQSAKYINSPESEFFQKSNILYGMHLARQAFKAAGTALICEGQMDVIACHQGGLCHAVAAQGTAFTSQHANLLKKSTPHVTLAFDGDTAGISATLRTITLLLEANIHTAVVTLPEKQDPDSIFRTGGPEALKQIMAGTEEAIPFVYRLACQQHDLQIPEEKSAAVTQILQMLCVIPDPIARTAHCQWLAAKLNLPENILLDSLQALLRQQQDARQRAEAFQSHATKQNTFPARPDSPPPFSMPAAAFNDTTTPILTTILDLILHFEFLARTMLQSDILHLIPDTPLGHAINLVLAATEQDEWEHAEQNLTNSELISNSEIGQVLAESKFTHLECTDDTSKEQQKKHAQLLEKALSDCQNRLLLFEVNQQMDQLLESISNTPNEQARELLQQYQELTLRKNQLKKACSTDK
jgi:DNA primase